MIESSEECDDSNVLNNDGWSQSCLIENDYIWTTGSNTSSSICTECSMGYTHNSDHSKCVESELGEQEEQMSYTILSMNMLGILFSFFSLLLAGASIAGIFGFINFLQMIVIIPMLGAYISKDVTVFIANLSGSLLDFNVLLPKDGLVGNEATGIHYPQNNSYLKLIDFRSSSGLLNWQVSVALLILLVLLGIIVFQVSKITKRYK